MSSPTFSIDPADYPDVVNVMTNLGLTPVIIVIGGSYSTNLVNKESDFDIWGTYLEDKPEEVSIGVDDRLSVLGDLGNTQMIFNSLALVRILLENPENDPAKKVWKREDFLACPRIFDSAHADDFRKELLEVPVATVAERYLDAGDWHTSHWDNLKMNTRAIRLYLTGARLLELDELIIDYQVLKTWAGDPTISEARLRLVTEIENYIDE